MTTGTPNSTHHIVSAHSVCCSCHDLPWLVPTLVVVGALYCLLLMLPSQVDGALFSCIVFYYQLLSLAVDARGKFAVLSSFFQVRLGDEDNGVCLSRNLRLSQQPVPFFLVCSTCDSSPCLPHCTLTWLSALHRPSQPGTSPRLYCSEFWRLCVAVQQRRKPCMSDWPLVWGCRWLCHPFLWQ